VEVVNNFLPGRAFPFAVSGKIVSQPAQVFIHRHLEYDVTLDISQYS
jgi:hypothetical protein